MTLVFILLFVAYSFVAELIQYWYFFLPALLFTAAVDILTDYK